jgi:hypothetical protein
MPQSINKFDRFHLYEKGCFFRMHHDDRKIREAAVKYFIACQFNDPCAVTLTMKQRVNSIDLDPITCSRNFSHFSNRLNKAILRNSFTRYGNRIPMMPVIERSHVQRYHYHTVIDRTEHVSRNEFNTKFQTKEAYSDSIDWQNLRRN